MGRVMAHYKPSEIAKIFGVSAQCVRVWEDRGLIPRAARTVGGHRRFTDVHIARIRELTERHNRPQSPEAVDDGPA